MGWLESLGWSKNDDPLIQELEPELQRYLKTQTPSAYKTTQEQTGNASQPQTYREQLGIKGHNDPAAQQKSKDALAAAAAAPADSDHDATPAPLPKQSLYQDGRYAHLWSTYRPQSELEEAGKSDQEKLVDIVRGYRERQAELNRAAMENCVDAQWAIHECFRHGSWSAVATMCKAENRELSRCVTMQTKFLRALGYLTLYDRPEEESEKIQMHADRLYQKMIREEKLTVEARDSGRDVEGVTMAAEIAQDAAATPSVLSTATSFDLPPSNVDRNPISWETLPADIQAKIMAGRFKGLQGVELELAKRELSNNLSFHHHFVQRMEQQAIKERAEMLQRQEEGNMRITDRVKQWFDFRQYPEMEVAKTAEDLKK